MPEILVALGSNLGNRLDSMNRALAALAIDIRWLKASGAYETRPMYVEDQPAFLNAAARGETDLGPLALLDRLKRAERLVGRGEAPRLGPREIDLDLIAYGRLQLSSRRNGRELNLPHPKLAERRFVLAPMAEVAPEWLLPGLGTVSELLDATNRQAQDVNRLNDAVLSICGDGRSR